VALILGCVVLGGSSSRIAAALLVGLALVIVLVNLPFVGGIFNVLLTVTGFGVAILEAWRWYRAVPALAAASR
jgi:hypothetical protein